MSSKDDNDDIFSRWSKRKQAAKSVKNETIVEVSLEEEKEVLEARELELTANREAAEEIDLDTIDEESDLSLFMKDGVPEALKKAALAKLWRSNPVFANIDGLVDYDDNFADPNLIMKTFTSAYQVGKGYLKEVLEETDDDDKQNNVEEESLSEETITEKREDDSIQNEVTEKNELEAVSTEIIDEYEASDAPKVSLRSRLGLADTKNQDI